MDGRPDHTGALVPGPGVLSARGVSKQFGGVKALDAVDVDIRPAEVHALLGGNGSGKSTFIKILAGVERADAGDLVTSEGSQPASSQTPERARLIGLHFVHQHSSVFPDLTVAENLAIGHGFERGPLGRIHWRDQRRRALLLLERFDIDASPNQVLGELSSAKQMMVAIARALQDQHGAHSGVLVLDEPTASLHSDEVDHLLDALSAYAAQGQSILMVTHRLSEVLRIASTATIFRDGHVVERLAGDDIKHDALVTAITGDVLNTEVRTVERTIEVSGPPVLEVTAPRFREPLHVQAGEIVGLAGLLGSGRTRLLRQVYGATPRDDVTVRVNGHELVVNDPFEAVRQGVALVPEDRPRDALFRDHSVARNLSMPRIRQYAGFLGRVDGEAEKQRARELVTSFGIKTASVDLPISALSGGNQQKVVLARWLQYGPTLLLLDEPTQGVDVGARREIYSLVRAAADAGAAVVVVSSEFEELVELCTSIVTVSQGRVFRRLSPDEFHEDGIARAVYQADSAQEEAA